jgi:tripartite-type tricarboxylate transporter receptor subunit TctC
MIAAAWLGTCISAQAQTYPAREMRVVIGLPAGSGGDVIVRFYADRLAQLSGKPVIVENKPGMILSIGADAVAKSKPDGYTILITSVTSSHAANLFMFKKLPYDPIKDFTPVAMLQRSYFILMVRPDAPWKTVAELTAAMQQKGAKASYG